VDVGAGNDHRLAADVVTSGDQCVGDLLTGRIDPVRRVGPVVGREPADQVDRNKGNRLVSLADYEGTRLEIVVGGLKRADLVAVPTHVLG
jgi:hypothetical protein